MTDTVYPTELMNPSAIHAALVNAATAGRQAVLTGPAGWRAPGTLATPDPAGRLPFFHPEGLLSALPMGTSVRVEFQGDRGTVSFYTQTRGTDGQGRWLLELPTILQVPERRQEARQAVAPGTLSVEHPNHGSLPVVDLSGRGLACKATVAVAQALQEEGGITATLRVSDQAAFTIHLTLRNVRRAPGEPLQRIVGSRFTSDSEAFRLWFEQQDDERGVFED